MEESRINDIQFTDNLVAGGGLHLGMTRSTLYHLECVRDGEVIWTEDFHNLVTDAGLNDSLDKHLKGSAYTAAWYVGLTSATPTVVAGDTMASHAGWTEVTAYTSATRVALTLGAVAAKSVDNSASKAVFTFNGSVTAGGAFIASDSTKSGTTGVLYGEGALSQNRAVISGDVINLTVTLTAAAA